MAWILTDSLAWIITLSLAWIITDSMTWIITDSLAWIITDSLAWIISNRSQQQIIERLFQKHLTPTIVDYYEWHLRMALLTITGACGNITGANTDLPQPPEQVRNTGFHLPRKTRLWTFGAIDISVKPSLIYYQHFVALQKIEESCLLGHSVLLIVSKTLSTCVAECEPPYLDSSHIQLSQHAISHVMFEWHWFISVNLVGFGINIVGVILLHDMPARSFTSLSKVMGTKIIMSDQI